MKKWFIRLAFLTCGLLGAACVTVEGKKVCTPCDKKVGADLNTLSPGLKYKILKEGTSERKPVAGQTVEVHYTGWLYDNGNLGKKFDSSVDRGATFKFIIGSGYVIPGWDLGVMDMKIGEKRRLVISPELAYGARGVPGAIPASATLVFDVELFESK